MKKIKNTWLNKIIYIKYKWLNLFWANSKSTLKKLIFKKRKVYTYYLWKMGIIKSKENRWKAKTENKRKEKSNEK